MFLVVFHILLLVIYIVYVSYSGLISSVGEERADSSAIDVVSVPLCKHAHATYSNISMLSNVIFR